MSSNKLHKLLMVAVVLLIHQIPFSLLAQEWCHMIIEEPMTLQKAAPYGDPQTLSAFLPQGNRQIYLRIHIVRYSNGSGGISQTNITTAVQQLNNAFNSNNAKIFKNT